MQPEALYQQITEIYGPKVAKEAVFPYHMGVLSKPHARSRHELANGEWIEFTLKIDEGRVTECWFSAHGNSIIFASASVLSRLVEGAQLKFALNHIDVRAVEEELGSMDEGGHFSILLVIEALRQALLEAVKYMREPWKRLYAPHR